MSRRETEIMAKKFNGEGETAQDRGGASDKSSNDVR